jgi:Ni,Fe-hydrogenase III large subunit/Ni,Fe-hydrogenase III component G
MIAREYLESLKARYGPLIVCADLPSESRLFLRVQPGALRSICREIFRAGGARYVTAIGVDDRPVTGSFLVAHNFAFDQEGLLCSVMTTASAEAPAVDSLTGEIPAASWAEREFRDLLGIEARGHHFPKRLVLADGWPDGVYPLRKDVSWDYQPEDYDEEREFTFDEPPPGCTVVPFGPFHPTLDEPAHFRLFVEGEVVRGCEYRGFMAHRAIEKLAESVLTYNDIPLAAERICGICGCVHNVAYAQAVEQAAALCPPVRAEFIRTIFLELERLHSHLLWVGLAAHILGYDTLFMQSWRIREPLMWIAEKISGNRKTYALCVVGGVRWDFTPELQAELSSVLTGVEQEWHRLGRTLAKDRNLRARAVGVGIATPQLVKELGLVGPVARASGIPIDCRRDHPYAAYDRVDFEVITEDSGDVWSRINVRVREVFESIRIIRQCLDRMPAGPVRLELQDELPVGRIGLSSVEAPRGEAHHFLITGENNRPRRWRVRAPTYQNLQGIPAMIQGQRLADMTITLGSIDPCFSCTDRLETVDVHSRSMRVYTAEELSALARAMSRHA